MQALLVICVLLFGYLLYALLKEESSRPMTAMAGSNRFLSSGASFYSPNRWASSWRVCSVGRRPS